MGLRKKRTAVLEPEEHVVSNTKPREADKQSARRRAKDEEQPWYLALWGMCFCSDEYQKNALVKKAVGSVLVKRLDDPRHREMKRKGYTKFISEDELPEERFMVRDGAKEPADVNPDRLLYFIDGDGVIVNAHFG